MKKFQQIFNKNYNVRYLSDPFLGSFKTLLQKISFITGSCVEANIGSYSLT